MLTLEDAEWRGDDSEVIPWRSWRETGGECVSWR